jgi:hypothetical protein
VKFTATVPKPVVAMKKAAAQNRSDVRRAAIIATDRASKEAQRALQQRIRSVGLGRLGGAVGQTSLKRERGSEADNPYGVIFARGGDDSLGGGALEAYSRGATIEPRGGNRWLWIASRAIPKFVSLGGRRYRITPQLYKASSLVSSIGKLEFKPIGPNRALYVIKRVTTSPKTGRAKAATGRRTRTRIPEKEIIAFVGIRVTIRAKRFDKDDVIQPFARRVPIYMREALEMIAAGRSGAG